MSSLSPSGYFFPPILPWILLFQRPLNEKSFTYTSVLFIFKKPDPMHKGKSWKSEHKFHRSQGLKELHDLRQGGQLLSVSTSLSGKQG